MESPPQEGYYLPRPIDFVAFEKPEISVFNFFLKYSSESSRLEPVYLLYNGNFSIKCTASHWLSFAIG